MAFDGKRIFDTRFDRRITIKQTLDKFKGLCYNGCMKTCDGCKAMLDLRYAGHVCDLGYRIRILEIKKAWGKLYQPVPDEKCPKPRTWVARAKADYK